MSSIRTLAPSLSALTGKDLATRVADSAAFIGCALRVATARNTSRPVLLTKAECAFLRSYVANSIDPLTALRECESVLALTAEGARTVALDTATPALDVPRIKAGQAGHDGRTLVLPATKGTSEGTEAHARILGQRIAHGDGAKALAMLGTIACLRAGWDAARASHVTFKAITGERAAKPAPKRLEAHAAAILAADPAQVAVLLKAMGLPDAAVGGILALMAAKAAPVASCIPALLPGPVG